MDILTRRVCDSVDAAGGGCHLALACDFRIFAEDYRIEPTDNGCQLTWSVLIRPLRIPERLLTFMRPLLELTLRRNLARLRAYSTARFDSATSA